MKKMKMIEKIKNNLWSILLVISLVLFLRQCGINRNIDKITKEIKSVNQRIDSIPNRDEILKAIEIEGLKTSKRTLYDWNSVVRTAVRPDDRMNQYDQEIQKIQRSK